MRNDNRGVLHQPLPPSKLKNPTTRNRKPKTKMKKTIAVFFGGRSPEHDVSVVSGLQVLQALDPSKFDAFPVYITTDGRWLIGDLLRDRANYLPTRTQESSLTEVSLDVRANDTGRKKGVLLKKKPGLFGANIAAEFDAAIPAFHGLYGEDGNIQGLFELANVPYTGMRTMATSILMDKITTKHLLNALDIPTLPFAKLRKTGEALTLCKEEIEGRLRAGNIGFPACIKPSHLGSSIGVAKTKSAKETEECLPAIFRYDNVAIAEPFVENLVEYNVAVMRVNGEIVTSAIERPKATDELLDFKQKYLSGGDNKTGNKTGTKTPGAISEGMLSLTRELNPKIPEEMEKNIREWAARMFDALDGTGAPRIDFIGNSKTGEIWMNEVNPIPGSFGYFLWEAGPDNILFSSLLTNLVEEALSENKKRAMPADPVPMDARLHRRHT